MLIHLVENAYVNTNKNNLWDKFFFLDDTNPMIIANTVIKCNRNIYVNPKHLALLFGDMIKNANYVLGSTDKYDTHGEIVEQVLKSDFLNLITQFTPKGAKFLFLGIAFNHNQGGNIEIRFKISADTEVVLNLHITLNVKANYAITLDNIIQAMEDFAGDVYALNTLKKIDLTNFASFNYRVAHTSQAAYAAYLAQYRKEEETFQCMRDMFALK